MSSITSPCRHTLHLKCVMALRRGGTIPSKTCPYCRADMPPDGKWFFIFFGAIYRHCLTSFPHCC